MISEVTVASEGNSLLAAYPIKARVPAGTNHLLKVQNESRSFVFESKEYTLTFEILPAIGSAFDPNINTLSQKVSGALGNPNNSQENWFVVFRIKSTFQLKPMRRFSKLSALSAEWFSRLKLQMDKDFSWDKLRTAYQR